MNTSLLSIICLAVCVAFVSAGPTKAKFETAPIVKKDLTDVALTKPATEKLAMEKPTKHNFRTARQIGYGAAGSGLQSQLSGISSGYGYGYNNAVGMGGLGQSQGSNLGLFPGLGLYGRR
ncbi:hypothetical protein BV898_15845 [Hypsibius exemplaris]|uniref:Uncharacterized protein n=1 Tax=Hypsibius exemplaris TaxID=2072580 RepID=A0A9X6NDK6_HYPEX|nr:hypothetical protein BV898_15845 [Hypsibius exemplaris]